MGGLEAKKTYPMGPHGAAQEPPEQCSVCGDSGHEAPLSGEPLHVVRVLNKSGIALPSREGKE